MFPRDIRYVRVPLRDVAEEDVYPFFDRVAEIIHQALGEFGDIGFKTECRVANIGFLLERNEPVLVHCRCGVSRSVTLVCAYLIRFQNMTNDEAIHFIQQRRPCANPILSFRHQLRSYAEKYPKRVEDADSKDQEEQ